MGSPSDRRPMHWVIREVVFYSILGVLAYLALRIQNPNGIVRESHQAIVR
jgi:hypothetical protein